MIGPAGLLALALLTGLGPGGVPAEPGTAALLQALAGPNPLAAQDAREALEALGEAAVPELARRAGSRGPQPARLVAVELLGRVGSETAREALLDLLAQEQDLAVRGQICKQLGELREVRALPLLRDWLLKIQAPSLNDVPGPKEIQPATCYIRHLEALGMIRDPAGIAILEAFRPRVPPNVGWHGFLTNFVTSTVDETLEDLRLCDRFWRAVRTRPGLAEEIQPLFDFLRADPVSRFRLDEDALYAYGPQGKTVLERLRTRPEPAVAKAAAALYDRWDALAPRPAGGAER